MKSVNLLPLVGELEFDDPICAGIELSGDMEKTRETNTNSVSFGLNSRAPIIRVFRLLREVQDQIIG